MNKKSVTVILIIFCLFSFTPKVNAEMPVIDAVNAALNELRNSLMQSQFTQDIALAMERLETLKATYSELIRFHSGFDDFFHVLIGDPMKKIFYGGRTNAQNAFSDFGWFSPKIEILNQAAGPEDIRTALEEITGPIPDSEARPYIPFEEMQVVDGFTQAAEIRIQGNMTREAAEQIRSQAKSASPKGAARLGVEAMSQVIVLTQENQEALAKLIELEATQVEQVSREEKREERERLRYMEEFRDALQTLWEVG